MGAAGAHSLSALARVLAARTLKRKTRIGLRGSRNFLSQPIQMQRGGGSRPSLAGDTSARGFRRVAAVCGCSVCPRHGTWSDPAFSPAPGHRRAGGAEVSPVGRTPAALRPQKGFRPYLKKNLPTVSFVSRPEGRV